MARAIRSTAVLPAGLALQKVEVESELTVITVRSISSEAGCPGCGESARRIHSRYARTLLDLPMGGRSVRLRVAARRFRCDASGCARKIFAERLSPVAAWVGARRGWTRWRITWRLHWAVGPRRGSPRA